MASSVTHEVTPNPKPQKRLRASCSEWKKIRSAFEFAVCVVCAMRPIELHHCVPRSQAGDDCVENLAPLCHQHHMDFESHAPGWERIGAALRQYIMANNERRNYVVGTLGSYRFNNRYPCLPNQDPRFDDDFRRIYSVHQTPRDAKL